MVRKVKKKKSKIFIAVAFLLMIGIETFVYKYIIIPGYEYIFGTEYDGRITLASSFDASVSISPDKLNSPNAILISLKDNTILMQKNSEEKIYPASLTKMMTAIVAIENLPNTKKEIKLANSMFQGLYGEDASMAGFQPGEQVKAIDLLYGALLPSGAECCIGLANQIAGSEQNFAKMMNKKAADLGMKNTHFENATGLQDENHYTTVKDLSILLSYALKNDTFREIFTSSRHSTAPTNKHPRGITFNSTMFEELKNQNIVGGEILGGKTGYTDKAGLCLASLAKVGKQEYILITAGAKGNHHTEQYNIIDALVVYSGIGK
ncbi:D-alanyl-D-alanine carboxypeptidase [Clostridium sp. 2-1]|uniref:D-alanyl-D-alanine carboxypeptidase family protein n=1 Tax=Clostridium TaxID=1485 RepID=UPI000CDB69A2|nr:MULTISPECIES: D-alanyl-D-alanine carboxypeptidase [Clostridium]MBN7573360.1 D-alanyl-D-alanine carboxypeptidase [Clostridium beijerinckii]MBN7578698.1 D-alanyl-D-alanine carboxypeptidase [Clostridium beijerinckii]MBN7583133.1 D-alanyl-D-alanine carboxypeptidase [Clostridium beijerinckii]MBO0519288.1 D-alanyl-D-alanine carboxypeptidase [Clostridium beijerinckii]POO90865.1 D-alanyl-D-alanine carboxypeptidase [Clostridium sp. 2-1]